MIDVINTGSGRNSASQDKFPRSILPRTFDFGFATGLIYKDLKLCMEEAEALDAQMWVGMAVKQLYQLCNNRCGPGSDFTEIVKIPEEWAGVVVGGGALLGDLPVDATTLLGVGDSIRRRIQGRVRSHASRRGDDCPNGAHDGVVFGGSSRCFVAAHPREQHGCDLLRGITGVGRDVHGDDLQAWKDSHHVASHAVVHVLDHLSHALVPCSDGRRARALVRTRIADCQPNQPGARAARYPSKLAN